MTNEQRMVPVELLEELEAVLSRWSGLINFQYTGSSEAMTYLQKADDESQPVLNKLNDLIDGPEVGAVAEWVKADYGDYPMFRWRANYVASIGDKFYLASPAPVPAVPDWQPIETAPRDGTVVLLFDGFMKTGHFDAGWPVWLEEQEYTQVKPTHWMPLPTPPASKGDEK